MAKNYFNIKKNQRYLLKLLLIITLIYLYYIHKKEKIFFIQPEDFERKILDEVKHRFKGKLLMSINEFYFVNGLIRMFKPKKILEIGVCTGGMSATILNSIKDIKGAMLYSCDLERKVYLDNQNDVGYIAKNSFPELLDKWKLYSGNTTAAFIEEIGGNIDFVFIDTAHVMPGEVLNIIEILPFLKDNAIVVFDDINHQTKIDLIKLSFFNSCNNILFSVLKGKKIMFKGKKNYFSFSKQGAIILEKDQKKYYFDYFLLLTDNWSYMPNQFEIRTIRELVKKYYSPYLLSIFDKAVKMNYYQLKEKGLLTKDYILYTFNITRNNPFKNK
jgi:predicted O-methyltransferase YrrM